jgi:hypothetical protein
MFGNEGSRAYFPIAQFRVLVDVVPPFYDFWFYFSGCYAHIACSILADGLLGKNQ